MHETHIIQNNTEIKYVEKTYNTIANEFSHTRFSVWSNVADFINSFPYNSLCLEVGCGNGKNMCLRDDLIFHGCDVAEEFVKICKDKGLNVITANNLSLPYLDNTYDYLLSIAVIHHLASYENRKQSIKELIRVTKPDGQIFIEVWALEQGDGNKKLFQTQDVLVPFRNKHTREILGNRFYHVFIKNELQKIISDINRDYKKINKPIVTIINEFYEKGNWGIIIQK